VPVLFDAADARYVPEPVRGHRFHVLTSEQAYEALCDFGRRGAAKPEVEASVGGDCRAAQRMGRQYSRVEMLATYSVFTETAI